MRATELVTALLWPALLMLMLFSYTFVLMMLGGQWLAIVSLVQIMTAARLFAYAGILDYAAILAAGAVRYTVPLMVVQLVSSLGVVAFTAGYGLHAVAVGFFFTTAFNGAVSLCLLRSLLGFSMGRVRPVHSQERRGDRVRFGQARCLSSSLPVPRRTGRLSAP